MADWMEELERLAELRDKGLITDEEFEVKRKEIINVSSEETPEDKPSKVEAIVDKTPEPAVSRPISELKSTTSVPKESGNDFKINSKTGVLTPTKKTGSKGPLVLLLLITVAVIIGVAVSQGSDSSSSSNATSNSVSQNNSSTSNNSSANCYADDEVFVDRYWASWSTAYLSGQSVLGSNIERNIVPLRGQQTVDTAIIRMEVALNQLKDANREKQYCNLPNARNVTKMFIGMEQTLRGWREFSRGLGLERSNSSRDSVLQAGERDIFEGEGELSTAFCALPHNGILRSC